MMILVLAFIILKIFKLSFKVAVPQLHNNFLIANAGLYGGTSIFGRLNRNYFSALVDGGCKDAIFHSRTPEAQTSLETIADFLAETF
jgi:hypothetical protein